MKIIRVTYIALATLFSVASCSKEATEPDVYDWNNGEIYIRTSLSDVVSTRGKDMTLDRLKSFQVTCFNSADREDQDGILSPYFENVTFNRKVNSAISIYESAPEEGPLNWPIKSGVMSFFAFSPSIEEMRADNTAIKDLDDDKINAYFKLINTTEIIEVDEENKSDISIGYRIGKVRINPDISRQFDFITAEAAGERMKDFAGGVDLAFSHKLCQVELKAWGASQNYNFDIAGVRIGNPVVEGTFVFADDKDVSSSGRWETDEESVKDKVEYLYSSKDDTDTGEQAGDKIFRINNREHHSQEEAASIMGIGGCAMVLPTVNSKWEGLDDPNIGIEDYKTDRMYFSILMRVADSESGKVVYPYPDNSTGMTVENYAVDHTGTIIRRLYPGESPGTYFIDPELQQPYEENEGVDILDFGWAAVPVDADWSAGKKYVYTLDYSEGIGIHDPSDPEPGKLIVGQVPIEWSVSVSDWESAEKDENYDPDLDVP